MQNVIDKIEWMFAGLGGFLGWFFGGFDGFLYALVVFVVCDYFTGVLASMNFLLKLALRVLPRRCVSSYWLALPTSLIRRFFRMVQPSELLLCFSIWQMKV